MNKPKNDLKKAGMNSPQISHHHEEQKVVSSSVGPETKDAPLVSVIIPAYNNENEIEDCMDRLFRQTYPSIEIVAVVDEGSRDRTLEKLQEIARNHPEKVQVLTAPPGPAAASRNVGWKHAKGEIFFFADADDLWNEDYLEKAVALLTSDPNIGVVTLLGTSIADESTLTSECLMVYSNITRKLNERKSYKPSWGWVFRREAIEKVGGFDGRFYHSDKDVFLRVKKAGYTVGLIKGVNWYHRRPHSFRVYARKTYRGGKRRIPFLFKNKKYSYFARFVPFWITVGLLVAGLLTMNTLVLLFVLAAVTAYLAYHLVQAIIFSWRVKKKRYIFIYPFFRLVTHTLAAVGHTYGLLARLLFGHLEIARIQNTTNEAKKN